MRDSFKEFNNELLKKDQDAILKQAMNVKTSIDQQHFVFNLGEGGAKVHARDA